MIAFSCSNWWAQTHCFDIETSPVTLLSASWIGLFIYLLLDLKTKPRLNSKQHDRCCTLHRESVLIRQLEKKKSQLLPLQNTHLIPARKVITSCWNIKPDGLPSSGGSWKYQPEKVLSLRKPFISCDSAGKKTKTKTTPGKKRKKKPQTNSYPTDWFWGSLTLIHFCDMFSGYFFQVFIASVGLPTLSCVTPALTVTRLVWRSQQVTALQDITAPKALQKRMLRYAPVDTTALWELLFLCPAHLELWKVSQVLLFCSFVITLLLLDYYQTHLSNLNIINKLFNHFLIKGGD